MVEQSGQLSMRRMKTCSSCANKILSENVYCRWCGAQQTVALKKYMEAIATRKLDNSRRSYATTVIDSEEGKRKDTAEFSSATGELLRSERPETYHRVSGELVNSVIKAFQSNLKGQRASFQARIYQVLMTISVYCIFILSAPIDAFIATKNLVKQRRFINDYPAQ